MLSHIFWRMDQDVNLQPGKFKSGETQTAGLHRSVRSVLLVYFHNSNFHKSDFLTTVY